MATLKEIDNGSKLLITAIIMVILQGTLLISVTKNISEDQEQERKIEWMWKNDVSTVFLEGIMKSYEYQTQEIVSIIGGDPEKIRHASAKYLDFRKEMLNMMQETRGGMTSRTRSIKPDKASGGSQ
jgi:hypothetical protein